jgi:hypothetical protein
MRTTPDEVRILTISAVEDVTKKKLKSERKIMT